MSSDPAYKKEGGQIPSAAAPGLQDFFTAGAKVTLCLQVSRTREGRLRRNPLKRERRRRS